MAKLNESTANKLDKLIHQAGGKPAAMSFLIAWANAPDEPDEVEVKVESKPKRKAKKKRKGGTEA